ncbi:hypothetical protein D3C72_1684110 [compost metagenome]
MDVPAEQAFTDIGSPAAFAHMGRQFGQAAARGHDEREDGVGGGLGEDAGRMAQGDAAPVQAGEVVVVDSDRNTRDHLQLARFGQLRRAQLHA